MQPSCHSGENRISTDGANNTPQKRKIPSSLSKMLSDFNTNAPFLSIHPIPADNFEDLEMNDACGQWDPLDAMGSPLSSNINDGLYFDACSPLDTSEWSQCLELDLDNDVLVDMFTASKVSRGDDPTLAALNAGGKTELEDLELGDLPLPEEINSQIRGPGLPTPLHDSQDCLSIPLICRTGANSNGTATFTTQLESEPGRGRQLENVKHSTLHELLIQDRPASALSSVVPQLASQEANLDSNVKDEPLSPKETYFEHQKWVMRRPRTSTLTSVESLGEETFRSTSSASDYSEDVKAEIKGNESHDEGFNSDLEDSEHENDCSDADSACSWDLNRYARLPSSLSKVRNKKERYFWQYNLQAKGPKGNRMPLSKDPRDPHMLDEVTDPVFSPTCQVKGIKHTGKARRGDGNDLTPNPTKLFQIGQELKKLNRVINDLQPVSEMPFNIRPKSRKEKNKLASRACRLKKKAQHEANKLKLFGLEQEHRRLMYVLGEMRKSMLSHTSENRPIPGELSQKYEDLTKNFLKTKVAGNTVEFVNRVLENVAAGNPPILSDK